MANIFIYSYITRFNYSPFMSTSVTYAITVTLLPKLFRFMSDEQYDKTYLEVYKHLRGLCMSVTIVVEHTKAFNIHYHGIVTMDTSRYTNCRKSFVDSFRKNKLFGFVCIKQIDDMPGWVGYMKKDLAITKSSIGRPPIIIDDDLHLMNPSDEPDWLKRFEWYDQYRNFDTADEQ